MVDGFAVAELGGESRLEAQEIASFFEGRGKHPWPPRVRAWPGWESLWERLAADEQLDASLEEMVTAVAPFVQAIDLTS